MHSLLNKDTKVKKHIKANTHTNVNREYISLYIVNKYNKSNHIYMHVKYRGKLEIHQIITA